MSIAEKIPDQLKQGEASAISGRALSEAIGVDDRLIRKAIFEMRRNNVAVISSNAGYFLPSVQGDAGILEALSFIKMMRHRGKSTFLSIRSAKNYISKSGQICFIDEPEIIEKYED